MIRAKVILDSNANYKAFSCVGHAGFSVKGEDIVCAAVSTLVINTANSIEQFTGAKFSVGAEEDCINFVFLEEPNEKAKLLMDAMILGLSEIQKSYSKKFLVLETEKISGGN